jgi:thiamine biosynthesis lipoprotein ApbE
LRLAGCAVAAWVVSVSCVGAVAVADDDFAFYHENVMGTSLELRVRAESEQSARWAEERVLSEIDRLSAILSGYDPASELTRWQATKGVETRVSAELFEVLQTCDAWHAQSAGAFDPRVGALARTWSTAARQSRVPTAVELIEAKARMSRPAWRLDSALRTAVRLSDCPLILNAITKNFIIERACNSAFQTEQGIRGLLLNVGGDIRACGEDTWTVGLTNPSGDSESTDPITAVVVKNQAVATSGNYQRGFRINGKLYSHIFDPRTGEPVARVASATVIADHSSDANALATTCNILEPDEGVRLVRSLPGAECLIATTDGKVVRSPGWARFERPVTPLLAFADERIAVPASKMDDGAKKGGAKPEPTAASWWGNQYELQVDFEINTQEGAGRRYRRPYVAVWIEDKDGFPVRTLLLWVSLGGAGPDRWLPDLIRWYRGDKNRKVADKTDLVHAIARATRQPGKYSVIWDGKDNHGKPLESGEYTVIVESAREHGTYQNIRKPLTIGDKPFAEELKGNVEIKSAAVEYRRKTPAK